MKRPRPLLALKLAWCRWRQRRVRRPEFPIMLALEEGERERLDVIPFRPAFCVARDPLPVARALR